MFTVKTRLAPSPIHGLGTFADEFIPEGMVLWRVDPDFDIEFSDRELDRLIPLARLHVMHYSYLSKATGRWILCADDARFMNHSSQPNTISGIDGQGGETTVAARDIQAGEEITCDYDEFDADADRKLGRGK